MIFTFSTKLYLGQVCFRVKMKQFTSIPLRLCYNCRHLPQTVLNACFTTEHSFFIKIKDNTLHFLSLAKSRCSNLLASCRPCIIKCISNSLTFLCFAFVPFMSLLSFYFTDSFCLRRLHVLRVFCPGTMVATVSNNHRSISSVFLSSASFAPSFPSCSQRKTSGRKMGASSSFPPKVKVILCNHGRIGCEMSHSACIQVTAVLLRSAQIFQSK